MANILVIDDDALIRQYLRQMLETEGHQVVEASNGRIAYEFAKIEEFDLTITDILMPEADGLETIRVLGEHFPNMPVIAMSGGSLEGQDYLPFAETFGAMYTLAKPFRRDALLEVVRAALSPEPGSPPPTAHRQTNDQSA